MVRVSVSAAPRGENSPPMLEPPPMPSAPPSERCSSTKKISATATSNSMTISTVCMENLSFGPLLPDFRAGSLGQSPGKGKPQPDLGRKAAFFKGLAENRSAGQGGLAAAGPDDRHGGVDLGDAVGGRLVGVENLVQLQRGMPQKMHRGVAVHPQFQPFGGGAHRIAPFHRRVIFGVAAAPLDRARQVGQL